MTEWKATLRDYPVPLGDGRWAYLRLPAPLSPADIEHIKAVLDTLAVEP